MIVSFVFFEHLLVVNFSCDFVLLGIKYEVRLSDRAFQSTDL